jgi:hypothetical protein
MAQACTVCNSPHKTEIDAALGVGATLATVSSLFEVTKSAAGRHKREHMSRTEVAPSGEHLDAADAMIEQARTTRTFDSYDEAEAVYLRTIAVALDARPENPSILSEFRRTLAGFRPEKPKAPATDEQWELAELIATLSGPPPGTWDAVYRAVITAGGSEDAAFAAASAACGNPDAIKWPGMIDGVPQGPLPTDAQLEALEARRQAVLNRRR